MIPLSLFERDKRFDRPNISIIKINHADHMPGVEKMEDVVQAIRQFEKQFPIKAKVGVVIEGESASHACSFSDARCSFALIFFANM